MASQERDIEEDVAYRKETKKEHTCEAPSGQKKRTWKKKGREEDDDDDDEGARDLSDNGGSRAVKY